MGDLFSKGCFGGFIVIILIVAIPFALAAAYLPDALNYAFYYSIIPIGILLCVILYMAQVNENRRAGFEPDASQKILFFTKSLTPLVVCIFIAYIGFKAVLPDMADLKKEVGYYDKPKIFVEEPYMSPIEEYRGHTRDYWNIYQEDKIIGRMSFKIYDDHKTEDPLDSARIWMDGKVLNVGAKEVMRDGRNIRLELSGEGLSSISIVDGKGELIKTDGTKYSFSRAGIIEYMIPNETHTWQDKMDRSMHLFIFIVLGPITVVYWLYRLINRLSGSNS